MAVKVQVIFHSLYTQVYQLAEAVAAGPRGERTPTANELAIARFQGRHVAQLAAKLSKALTEERWRAR